MVDSHAHLTDRRIEELIFDIRAGYLASGVNAVVDVGCSIPSSQKAMLNAEGYSEVYFTAGCHPDDAGSVNTKTLDIIKQLSSHPKCIAVGEIGLDYHYLNFDREIQKSAFISQLDLAVEVQKPVVIHTRDACKDTLDILCKYAPKLKGFIMHCFSESKETAKILLDLGAYFYKALREVAIVYRLAVHTGNGYVFAPFPCGIGLVCNNATPHHRAVRY